MDNKIQILDATQGLNDLVEVINFIFLAVETFHEAKADGNGLELADLSKVFRIIDSGTIAYDNYQDIPREWLEATEDQKVEIFNLFKEKFYIPNEAIETKVEKAVQIAYLVGDLFIK